MIKGNDLKAGFDELGCDLIPYELRGAETVDQNHCRRVLVTVAGIGQTPLFGI